MGRSCNWSRKEVQEKIWGLDLLPADIREKVVTAGVTTWAASLYERLDDMPDRPAPTIRCSPT
jgi:hypothetical protein